MRRCILWGFRYRCVCENHPSEIRNHRMPLKTILYRVEHYKSFVFSSSRASGVRSPAAAPIRVRSLVGHSSRLLVCQASDALEDRTAEKSGSHIAQTSGPATQLVPRPRHDFLRYCRRSEQQGKTDYQKIVGISNCKRHRNRLISSTRRLPEPEFTHRFCGGGGFSNR